MLNDVVRTAEVLLDFDRKHRVKPHVSFNPVQLQSFNLAVLKELPDMVRKQFGRHEWTHENQYHVIVVRKITLSRPVVKEDHNKVRPLDIEEAILRDLDYVAAVKAHIVYGLFSTESSTDSVSCNTEQYMTAADECVLSSGDRGKYCHMLKFNVFPSFPFFNHPVMMNSYLCRNLTGQVFKQCMHDPGCSFIINGNSRVIGPSERLKYNYPFVFEANDPKFDFQVQMRSDHHGKHRSSSTINLYVTHDRKFKPRVFCMKTPNVPVQVMYYALGWLDLDMVLAAVYMVLRTHTTHERTSSLIAVLRTSFENTRVEKLLSSYTAVTDVDRALLFVGHASTRDDYSRYAAYSDREARQVTPERMIQEARKSIYTEFLPHAHLPSQGMQQNSLSQEAELNFNKGLSLADMLARCLLFMGDDQGPLIKADNRDSMVNKRMVSTGEMFCNLQRQSFVEHFKSVRQQLSHAADSRVGFRMRDLFADKRISHDLVSAVNTGKFGLKKQAENSAAGSKARKSNGVSNICNTTNVSARYSQINRIVTPIHANGKEVNTRRVHDYFGVTDPVETPEGENVGVIKNMALSLRVSEASDDSFIIWWLYQNQVMRITPAILQDVQKLMMDPLDKSSRIHDSYAIVKVNGKLVGYTYTAQAVTHELRQLRRSLLIDPCTGISFNADTRSVTINTDGGRSLSPLLVLDNLKRYTEQQLRRMTWDDLVHAHVIELIDKEEEQSILIAPDETALLVAISRGGPEQPTHGLLHPSFMLGFCSSMIVFSEHNQSPRNTYQCLKLDELVLMADGSRKTIADVRIGDHVVTFDPSTMLTATTAVVNHLVAPTEKPLYTITTSSGRAIVATHDHKFMTSEGWQPVEALIPGQTKVGVSLDQEMVSAAVELYTIHDGETFLHMATQLGVTKKLAEHHVRDLTAKKLLPLHSQHTLLPILARLAGFTLSDGSLGICHGVPKLQATLSDEESGHLYTDDVVRLGFNRTKLTYVQSIIKGSLLTGWHVEYTNSLSTLLVVLGLTLGKRTRTAQEPVPKWILNGSRLVKREFLAGIQGGDGCKIRCNKVKNGGHNFISAWTSMSKLKEHAATLQLFMKQCETMLNELGIDTIGVIEQTAKHNSDMVAVGYKVRDSQKNLIKLFDTVGYRYDRRKTLESGLTVEFMRYRQRLLQDNIECISRKRKLHDEGHSNSDIAVITGCTTSKVSDEIRAYKAGRAISLRKSSPEQTPERWKTTVMIKGSYLFVPVESVRAHPNCLIADITTESSNHSFIAGDGFCVHNSSMGKQAIGIPFLNLLRRFDWNLLFYPTKPICSTKTLRLFNIADLAMGHEVNIAVLIYGGMNQDDSVIFSSKFVQLGGMRALKAGHIQMEEKCNGSTNSMERFQKPTPDRCEGRKYADYSNLDDDGLLLLDSYLDRNTVAVGKVVTAQPVPVNGDVKYHGPLDRDDEITEQCRSLIATAKDEGRVDEVILTNSSNGNRVTKTRYLRTCVPEEGDKFASRHGQKGTQGAAYAFGDMPFTEDGETPDVLINPHAFVSRMTIGMIKEIICGKLAVYSETMEMDGTAFSKEYMRVNQVCHDNVQSDFFRTEGHDIDYDEPFIPQSVSIFDRINTITAKLKYLGHQPHGNVRLYHGEFGSLIGAYDYASAGQIYYGPCYYQKLTHQVKDKIHARNTGPVNPLTKQATEGRSNDGGLKMGEMERGMYQITNTPVCLCLAYSVLRTNASHVSFLTPLRLPYITWC